MERADSVEVGSFVFASACYCSFTAFLLVVSTNEIDGLAVDDGFFPTGCYAERAVHRHSKQAFEIIVSDRLASVRVCVAVNLLQFAISLPINHSWIYSISFPSYSLGIIN